jgi:hypothetical protein
MPIRPPETRIPWENGPNALNHGRAEGPPRIPAETAGRIQTGKGRVKGGRKGYSPSSLRAHFFAFTR